MTLRELKKQALDKFSQGDVNIYALADDPKIKTTVHESPVLVIGQTGNHHRLTGEGFRIGKNETGQFVVKVEKKGVRLTHEQHVPPIALEPGWYLFDRAIEKGMFDDMLAPVAD